MFVFCFCDAKLRLFDETAKYFDDFFAIFFRFIFKRADFQNEKKYIFFDVFSKNRTEESQNRFNRFFYQRTAMPFLGPDAGRLLHVFAEHRRQPGIDFARIHEHV